MSDVNMYQHAEAKGRVLVTGRGRTREALLITWRPRRRRPDGKIRRQNRAVVMFLDTHSECRVHIDQVQVAP